MNKTLPAVAVIWTVMLVLPLAAVRFAPGDAGMAICFLLFFGINPLCSVYVGIVSGMAVKRRWYLPVMNAGAFLLAAWWIFTPAEPAFAGYAAAYLGIAVLAMGITGLVLRIAPEKWKR